MHNCVCVCVCVGFTFQIDKWEHRENCREGQDCKRNYSSVGGRVEGANAIAVKLLEERVVESSRRKSSRKHSSWYSGTTSRRNSNRKTILG